MQFPEGLREDSGEDSTKSAEGGDAQPALEKAENGTNQICVAEDDERDRQPLPMPFQALSAHSHGGRS